MSGDRVALTYDATTYKYCLHVAEQTNSVEFFTLKPSFIMGKGLLFYVSRLAVKMQQSSAIVWSGPVMPLKAYCSQQQSSIH